jgi:superoxide dismutase, Fe-Mn family
VDIRMQELPFDPAALRDLSDKLLRGHHQNNYGGAVKRLNAIRSQLSVLDFATAPVFQVNGLKREELIATNSMLLHELYFGTLGGRRPDHGAGDDLGTPSQFRQRRPLAFRVRRHGQGPGWWLGLGAADLPAA